MKMKSDSTDPTVLVRRSHFEIRRVRIAPLGPKTIWPSLAIATAVLAWHPTAAAECDPRTGEGCEVVTSDYGTAALPTPNYYLTWQDLGDARDVFSFPAGRGRALELGAHNNMDEDLYVHVEAVLRDDQGMYAATISSGDRVEPGTLVSIDISPEALASDLSQLAYSAEMRVMATFTNSVGDVVGRATAPSIYLHTRRRSVLAYGYEALTLDYGGGDLSSAGIPDLPLKYPSPENLDPDLADAPPPNIIDPDEIELCFQYNYEFVDSGTGEDFYATTELDAMWMRARSILVSVTPPGLSGINQRTDSEGCIIVPHSTGVYDISVEADVLMAAGGKNIQFDGEHSSALHIWSPIVDVSGADAGERIYVELSPSHVTDAMAAASQTIHRLLQDLVPLVDAYFTLDTGGYDHPYCQVACKSDDTLYYNPDCNFDPQFCDPGVTKEKYGVGHEVGHFVQDEYVLASDGDSYNDFFNVFIDGCSFLSTDGPGGHAIRSLEKSGAALNEGFAHYVATIGWNRHRGDFDGDMDSDEFDDLWSGNFVYYKAEMLDPDGQYDDMVADNWRVALAGQHIGEGDLDWREACEYIGDVPDGYETEIDWLRFFWDLRSFPVGGVNAPTPTTQDILEAMADLEPLFALTASEDLWCVDSVTYPSLRGRWQSMAIVHGVDPVSPPSCN